MTEQERAEPRGGPRPTTVLVVAGAVVVVTALLAARDRLILGEAGTVELLNGNVVLSFPVFNALLIGVMTLGTLLAVVVVALLAAVVGKGWHTAVAVFLAGVLAWLGAKVMKAIVDRGRPVELLDVRTLDLHGGYASITGAGYPSGHTCVAFAMSTVLSVWVPPRVRWIVWTLATVVGVARIYVAAHFPLDVLGGAALGVVVGSVVNLAFPPPAPEAAPAG